MKEWPIGVGKDDALASEQRKRACYERSAVTESSVEVVLREMSKSIRTVEPDGQAGVADALR